METYLVPIDFSQASIHAAEFAAALSKQTHVKHVVLLNAYYVSPIETMLPNADMVQLTDEDIQVEAANRTEKLEQLKYKLEKKVRKGVEVSVHLNFSHLVDAIVENVIVKKADQVILGSKGNTSKTDSQVGSHVINISKSSPVPVLAVPPQYHFDAISRVVLACDFLKIEESFPLNSLKHLLDGNNLELLVINVDKEAEHLAGSARRAVEETAVHSMLAPYGPKYTYINDRDVINGILQFATERKAQVVITMPHKYGFFESLLHTSISEKLTENAAIPVLLLK